MGSRLCSGLKNLLCRSSREDRSIKLITVDGKVMRFKRPVYVKEIVEEYPHHGIFDAGSVKCWGTNVVTRPLDHNSELQAGQLYYLIPLSSSAGSGSLEELKQIYSHPATVSASSIDGSHVLRVKLRMRKGDLVSFLNSTRINFGEKFVIKERPILAMGQLCCKSGPGYASSWKPNLDTITESNCLSVEN